MPACAGMPKKAERRGGAGMAKEVEAIRPSHVMPTNPRMVIGPSRRSSSSITAPEKSPLVKKFDVLERLHSPVPAD
jgi:hypothetical protein